MAFTPEQKRAYRKRKKAEKEESNNNLGQQMLIERPPDSKLHKPYKKSQVGTTTIDYGGHQKALNFPTESELFPEFNATQTIPKDIQDIIRIGTLTIGLVYEGDWKANSKYAGKGKRTMCLVSERYLPFLKLVKIMLEPMVHPTLKLLMDDSMRVNLLRGASTIAHTDAYKGNPPNYMYIPKEVGIDPGYLCYDVFPKFKHSMVKLFGNVYIPHSYSEASGECRCIGAHPRDPNKPIYYVFPHTVIDHMEPYADLSFGVVGWKANGELQIVEKDEDCCLYTKPLIFIEYTWQQILYFASKTRVHKRPRKRVYKLCKTNTWMEFEASMYRHWWVGNPYTLRIHVFFRTIREATPSSNIIRKGHINYINAKDITNWKMHDNGNWVSLKIMGCNHIGSGREQQGGVQE